MNRPPAHPWIIAHRGASHDAPENTLAAFQLAWQQGADGIEGDFRLTADGQIVCVHDADMKRTAGIDLKVERATLAELARLDVGSWKGTDWAGQRVVTLEEVMATVEPGKKLFIELKSGPQIVPALRDTIARCWLPRDALRIIAFDEQVVRDVKAALPDCNACLLVAYQRDRASGRWQPGVEEILEKVRRCGADGLGAQANKAAAKKELADRLHQAGLELHVWTVNDAQTAAYFRSLGVHSITTDRPDLLRSQLSR